MSKFIITMILIIASLAMGFTKPKASNSLVFQTKNLADSPIVDSVVIDTLIEVEKPSAILLYGTASFYHNKFVGRKTASGAIFSQEKLTCAHRTIPLGKMVRVTNLSNGISVDLLVNDRMGKSRHAIDLTLSAAKTLQFVQKGFTKVSIEVLD